MLGNTDAIRAMLREQKRECSALHAHPLYRAFRREALRHERAVARDDEDGAATPPAFDDLDAEALTRLFAVVHSAAAAGNKQPLGVWAEFGKPYAPCGTIIEPSGKLPRLNIDAMGGSSKHRRPPVRKSTSLVPDGPSIFRRPLRHFTAGHGASGPGTGGSEAARQQAASRDAGQLLKHKAAMQFTTLDRTEASFPAAPLRQSDARRLAVRARPNAYFSASAADADAADPAGAYGHIDPPRKPLPGGELLQRHKAAAGGGGSGGGGGRGGGAHLFGGSGAGAFFITQRGTVGVGAAATNSASGPGISQGELSAASVASAAGAPAPKRAPAGTAGSSAAGGPAPTAARGLRISVAAEPAGACDQRAAASQAAADDEEPPEMPPLTEPTRAEAGPHNPVPQWHNSYRRARQAGRSKLQRDLWARCRRRTAFRSSPALAGGLTGRVMADLEAAGGRLAPGWVPGTVPESPFNRADRAARQRQRRVEVRAASTCRALKREEVALLEHFYSSLCGLVERQRISDPLSLVIVHKTKELLEDGAFLHRPLLQRLLDAVSAFVHECGLTRHNRFAAPLLVFVRKCVGVGPEDFAAMVEAARLGTVLYADGCAAAAGAGGGGGAAAEAEPSGGSGLGGGGPLQEGRAAGKAAPPAADTAGDAAGARPQLAGAHAPSNANKPSRMPSMAGAPGIGRSGSLAAAAAAAGVAPIDVALAVASREIGEAIATARSAQSAASGRRVPGVARSSTPQTKAGAEGGDGDGGDGDGDGGGGGPAAAGAAVDQGAVGGAAVGERPWDSEAAVNGAAAAEEALPDLGLTDEPCSGRPSRRPRGPQVAREAGWEVARAPPREDDGDGGGGPAAAAVS
ncbi:hypothetical protein Rsub_02979 [Raphidocelis subcapitata]|uniref:Uncharacterized protein n=1 Tax=Raphidocelis subcapitata TaxID=307507 RepID=A0A2V0NYL4_9CHLO|nr:hypothetical protein Rsub_02979 [Raphidocelis subcapitata]|eukprot:GBF90680.1 hypothetical protein Rsub_02979 [Raphidocelis subcapitata]